MLPTSGIIESLERAVRRLGGSERPGQVKMALAVGEALAEGRHLLVQAGTGTGKSLAYLIPALIHAVQTNEPVIVATATLVLQRQIMEHDLPVALAALAPALERRPTAALLKGRQNYICLSKVAGAYPDEEEDALFAWASANRTTGEALPAEVLRLTAWAGETTTGDRDDFPGGCSTRAWQRVSVTALRCTGLKCEFAEECFAERARAAAAAADLVVTNHAMLAMAAVGAVALPEHSALVIDEAHQLVHSITSSLTGALTPAGVERAASAVRRAGSKETDLDGVARPLDDAAQALAAALASQLIGLDPSVSLKRLTGDLPEGVAQAVGLVAAAGRAAFSQVHDLRELTAAHKASVGGALLELIELCERLGRAGARGADAPAPDPTRDAEDGTGRGPGRLGGGGSEGGLGGTDGPGRGAGADVVWVAVDEWGDSSLNVAPLDVASVIGPVLLADVSAVATSATLALGGRMAAAARSMGLADGEWDGLDVGSPFDYGRQGILYLAADLPQPGRGTEHRAAQQARISELIEASGGGALGLFTSVAAAAEAAQVVRAKLGCKVALQGEKTMAALLEEFVDDKDACLFGTNSLWQGVDAPGLTCRLVIIDRLAFPRPDDPVMAARAEAADRDGASGFMSVFATHAALMLAQGAGRLIRSATDRGVVAILDPRLATKRYGSFLIKSMPPMWYTTSLPAVVGALRRLSAGDT
ncbi:MAG: ATP-dependent DNA helicase [Bifidobacteriaceae bacterium]|nr:ATP-dependent DNA helicase [Bifidobacteriaceae bacterium]